MSGLTVRAARGDELRDLVALSCARHGRAEDALAWRWRYQGYPGGGVRTFLGITGQGRIEAGCGVLPRDVDLPDGTTVSAGLVVDLACGWSPVAAAALAAVLAAAEAECFVTAGMRFLVVPGGPVPENIGPPQLSIHDFALAPPGLLARWRAPKPLDLLPGESVPVPGRRPVAARLRRDLPWLHFRFRDRPRVRGPLLVTGSGAEAWHVALELHEDRARIWPGDLPADRLEGLVAGVRRQHAAVGEVRVALPSHAASPARATLLTETPVWIRSAQGAPAVERWHVDLEDVPLELSTLGAGAG